MAGCGAPGEDAPERRGTEGNARRRSTSPTPARSRSRSGTRRCAAASGARSRTSTRRSSSKYPNVTIKRVAKSFTDLNTTLKLAVSSDEAPDVVQANQGRQVMGTLVKGGLLRPARRLRRRPTAGPTATRPCCSTSTASRPTARRSATATSTACRRWARSWGSSTTATRCRTRRRTFAELESQLAEAKSGGRRADLVRQSRQVAGDPRVPVRPERLLRRPTRCATSCSAARAPRSPRPRTRRRPAKLQDWAERGLLHEELQRRRLRPRVAAVRQGRRAVPDRRHVAAAPT